ncbi:MAG: DUF6751 family protein [Clostridium sp.]
MAVFFKNANITLYNRYYSKEDDCCKYHRSLIEGVNWQGKRNTKLTDKGLMSEDSILIFISNQLEKKYIGPKAFSRLNDIERYEYFTFQPGDIIVKGILDFDITGTGGNTIKYLENYYDDVIKILTIADWGNHWEIGGK